MARFHTLDDLAVAGRRVLLRADLNVPVQNGEVGDRTRIERLVPTIQDLRQRGARVVLMSHFGRPKGHIVADMSLLPVAPAVSQALGGVPIAFAPDCIGAAAADMVAGLSDGDVGLLENLRFHAGEEANDSGFADALAALGDLYVNDAFSAAHRAHASTTALAEKLPAAAGRAMQAELVALDRALAQPKTPVVALVGGAKISSKISVLEHLVGRVQHLIIGGAMANTFLLANGHGVGASLVEADLGEMARDILAKAEAAATQVHLPRDVVLAQKLAPHVDTATVVVSKVPDDMMILDIGPRSVADLIEVIAECRTMLWNGPLGAFEIAPFDAATNAVATAAAAATRSGQLLSVAGGGDTVAALNNAGVADAFSYISTAGGAFLEWLEGRTLPGVAALEAAATIPR